VRPGGFCGAGRQVREGNLDRHPPAEPDRWRPPRGLRHGDKAGGEFRHFLRERVRRNKAEPDRVFNPATRQRQNRHCTPADYRALLDAVIARQPRDPATGAMIDSFTKEPLGDNYHLGHVTGREWRTVARRPEYKKLTPREIAILELDPKFYVLQTPASNQGGRFEGSPRKRAIRRRELPEGARAP